MLSVSLLTLGSPEQLTGGYLYQRRMADLAAANDAKLRFVSFAPKPFPLAALQSGAVMREALQQRPDVVLVDSLAATFLSAWLSTHRVQTPLAAILHQPPGGVDHEGWRRRAQVPFDLATYRHTSLLILASEALKESLPNWLTLNREVVVVPPGRDLAAAATKPPSDLRMGRATALLCVGNWLEHKGILQLLSAFAALPADSAVLHLVGRSDMDPEYSAQVRTRLAQSDLSQRVVVHGAVEPTAVADMYASVDAFVLASTRETFGTVYAEAMTAGLPVVGWRAGNLPNLVEHEREGLLVELGDVTGLTAALLRLTQDEPLRLRMGDAAGRRADSLPTWEASARSLFDALRAHSSSG